MAIDYRLANEVLNRRPDYSLGDRIVQGGKIIRDSFDRSRELDRRALQDQQRQKMQTFGDFVGEELATGNPAYPAIAAQMASLDPQAAIKYYNDVQDRQLKEDQGLLDYEIEMAKLKPSLGPNILNQASQNKFRARQLANIISTSQDPAEVEASKLEYGNLVSDYEQNTKPFILQKKNSGTMINELGILPLNDALQARKQKQLEFSKGQEVYKKMLRDKKIYDSEFISKSVKDYEALASRDGSSLQQVRNLQANLEKAYELAYPYNKDGTPKYNADGTKKKPSVAAMHALNILTNKTLDPNSAVLLSEAQAFDEQDLISILKRMSASLTGIDPKTFNVNNVYTLAKANVAARANNAKKLAEGKRDFINKELESVGSKRRITLDTLSPFLSEKEDDSREKKIIKTLTAEQVRQIAKNQAAKK